MKSREYNFDFVGKIKSFGTVSLILVLVAFGLLFSKGLNYGIDFSGGTEVQIRFNKDVPVGTVRQFVSELGFKAAQVQKFGEESEFLIRFENPPAKTDKEANEILTGMIAQVTGGVKDKFSASAPEIRRVDSVGPQVGAQLKRNSVLAAFYCFLFILIYVAMRFDYQYAPGAVICLFHDAMVTLGALVIIGTEINSQIVAAILTLIGYSLNDTIVTFDRIRENTHTYKGKAMDWIVNRSINDILIRSFLTSITVLLAVLALFLFAGGVIRDFALTMMIGVVFGTYSSIYIASPLILVWERLRKKA